MRDGGQSQEQKLWCCSSPCRAQCRLPPTPARHAQRHALGYEDWNVSTHFFLGLEYDAATCALHWGASVNGAGNHHTRNPLDRRSAGLSMSVGVTHSCSLLAPFRSALSQQACRRSLVRRPEFKHPRLALCTETGAGSCEARHLQSSTFVNIDCLQLPPIYQCVGPSLYFMPLRLFYNAG